MRTKNLKAGTVALLILFALAVYSVNSLRQSVEHARTLIAQMCSEHGC